MKILFVGGGTSGSISPLLAVAEEIRAKYGNAEFLFVGTKNGPEKVMVEYRGFDFVSISAGKLRRYWSFKNLLTPFQVMVGFVNSLLILKKFKPEVVFGAGSFAQVPMVWAAFVLGIPVVLHQQDLVVSLANSLCQIFAKKITVTFTDSLKDFTTGSGILYKKNEEKVILTGNPFSLNTSRLTREEALKTFNLQINLPTLLVLGGGTGAKFINDLVIKSLPELTKLVQVIHSTGNGKQQTAGSEKYKPFEFILNMQNAYSAADIVLSRAGLSTITELSNLGKIGIVIPMPNSHQELNAFFLESFNAALVEHQNSITPEKLVFLIRKLLYDGKIQKELIHNMSKVMPRNSSAIISEILLKFTKN